MTFNIEKAKKIEAATGHSYCSPSQLYRIILCPGSLSETTKAPIQPPSSYAQEGTRKHSLLSNILSGQTTKVSLVSEKPEDREEILSCIDYDTALQKKLMGSLKLGWVEKLVDLGPWGFPEIWGTSDRGYICDNGRIDVIDWKFGSGVTVYAQDNAQLMAYAAGAIGYPDDQNLTLHLHIVQPPVNHYDEWVISFKQLETWVFGALEPALQDARSEDPPFNPGEHQCQFCPAAMTCKHRYNIAVKNAQEVFAVYKKDLTTISKQKLADLMEKISDLQSYASQIIKFAQAELEAGRKFPGYKLVSGRSIRQWIDEERAEAWLKGNSSLESIFAPLKLLSPAQAEKQDRLLKKDKGFLALIDKPPGKPQLVKLDDPRPALEPSSVASEVFKDVK